MDKYLLNLLPISPRAVRCNSRTSNVAAPAEHRVSRSRAVGRRQAAARAPPPPKPYLRRC
eukprot:365351-Chlamydomonas_euryale.AAC.2